MENKYHKGKIYKIVDANYTKCYYGSTIKSLSSRMAQHRSDYRNNKKHKCTTYQLFDDYGIENCKIELVEAVKCESKDELNKIEGGYIRNNDCINKRVAGQSKAEYKERNAEALKKRYEEYKEEHREFKKEKDRLYRLQNIEKIKANKTQQITCDCGSVLQKCEKANHLRTIKHIKFMEQQAKPKEMEL